MRKIKNYVEFFKILESKLSAAGGLGSRKGHEEAISSTKKGLDPSVIKKEISELEAQGIDLRNKEHQKALCQELIKQFDDNMNNKNFELKIDYDKVQAQAQSKTEVSTKNESRINESHGGGHSLIGDVLHLSIEILEKLEDLEFLKHSGGVAHGHGHIHHEGESEKDEEARDVNRETFGDMNFNDLNDPEVKKSISSCSITDINLAKELLLGIGKGLIKGVIGILKGILNVGLWVLSLIERGISWIMRNIFGLSHKKTSQGTKLVLAGITIAIIVFFSAPALASGAAFSVWYGVIPAFMALGGKLLTVSSMIRGIFSIFINGFKAKSVGGGKDIITCIEFLDEIEKEKKRTMVVKSIKISKKTRDRLEQIDFWLSNHVDKQKKLSEIFKKILNSGSILKTLQQKIPLYHKLFLGGEVNDKDLNDFEKFAHNPSM
jgi:hypothetical protein